MVIVDTSVWSLALRRRSRHLSPGQGALKNELVRLIDEDQAVLLGAIRQEVLSGIRDAAAFERLRLQLRGFEDLAISADDYEEAARCQIRCAARGIAGSPVDFLICAAALRLDAAVFTTDHDFVRYAKHLPITLHRPES